MITIACWKWKRIPTGHQLPNVCDYTADHVNTLQGMLERNLTIDHRFVCITDEPEGIHGETIPIWELYEAGGCYHRLRAFGEGMGDLLGPRFAWIDLDCVITGNVDHLFGIDNDFAINRYPYEGRPFQFYNGGLVVMDAGCRKLVWELFDPRESPARVAQLNAQKKVIGTDQAWISLVLGDGERTFDKRDGVYEAMTLDRMIRKRRRTDIQHAEPPEDAAIVFFSGPRDPSRGGLPWVRRYYR